MQTLFFFTLNVQGGMYALPVTAHMERTAYVCALLVWCAQAAHPQIAQRQFLSLFFLSNCAGTNEFF
jgi:hypothetical protein